MGVIITPEAFLRAPYGPQITARSWTKKPSFAYDRVPGQCCPTIKPGDRRSERPREYLPRSKTLRPPHGCNRESHAIVIAIGTG